MGCTLNKDQSLPLRREETETFSKYNKCQYMRKLFKKCTKCCQSTEEGDINSPRGNGEVLWISDGYLLIQQIFIKFCLYFRLWTGCNICFMELIDISQIRKGLSSVSIYFPRQGKFCPVW